ENFLDEIGGIVLRFAAAPRPEEEERRVEMDEPLPGRVIACLAQPIQKSDGCRVDVAPCNQPAAQASVSLACAAGSISRRAAVPARLRPAVQHAGARVDED